jgi:hypothetical protein
MMGHAATGDAKKPETVLGRRRHVLEASPGNNEDLGHHVVDLVPRNSTCHVRGDVGEMARVRELKFRLPLIAHPDPRSYSAQYLFITTTHARECRKPVNIRVVFSAFIGQRVNFASPIDMLTFLFTDIEGSTSLLRRRGLKVLATVKVGNDVPNERVAP